MNRRNFLRKTTSTMTGIAAAALLKNSVLAEPASRVVDTHVHFYDPTRKEGVPWPSKGTSLYRPVLPKDWQAVANPLGVKEVVVVEASSWLEDNAWVLELAEKEPCIVGFVGHLLPHEVDFPKHLKRFGANPIFRGFRVNGGDFSNHCESAEFRSGIKLMTDMGLELDLNIGASTLKSVAKLAADVRDLRIVVNHVASAGDATKLSKEWLDGMQGLEKYSNVYCKVSALQEQTIESGKAWGHASRETAYYAPILDHCWKCFGENRLIYGSNWPVSEKGGSYADQFKIVNEYFSGKSKEACEKYFWKNASTAYRWTERAK